MTWLPYSIAATVFLGISMAFWKMPSFKNYSSFFSTFWTNIFSVILVLILLTFRNPSSLNNLYTVSWYALAWGACFAVNMVLMKILLQNKEAGAVFPVTSSLGSLTTIFIGIIFLSEHVSIIQTIGILAIILSVYLFSRKGGSFPLDLKTIVLSIGIIASSTISKYFQKLGAVHDTVEHFMVWQYVGAALFAILIATWFERKNFKEIFRIEIYWKGAFLISIFSIAGGWAIFQALKTGPLSGVYAIHPAYTFISAIFAYFFFKEKLTLHKIALILLTIMGVILIKIG